MPVPRFSASLVSVALALAAVTPRWAVAEAQAPAPLHIYAVTLSPGATTMTIVGTGFGPAPAVTVHGQPAQVLPGGTEQRIETVLPSALLGAPGTHRITVVDPARQVEEVFVVATTLGAVVSPSTTAHTAKADIERSPREAQASRAIRALFDADSVSSSSADPALVEGPENTAVGVGALVSNTFGFSNSAFGVDALRNNGTGSYNTASGRAALYSNTDGYSNTASGLAALGSTTTGSVNTASGVFALYGNTGGSQNTATGVNALYSNTTGSSNTASGRDALYSNTTGNFNTVSGVYAAHGNTTGYYNTVSGVGALISNTTGRSNTAMGLSAGADATGSFNIYVGAEQRGIAGESNTMRLGLPYNGTTGAGQDQTFIAGIYGTTLTGPTSRVIIDANGQLGTLGPSMASGAGTIDPTLFALPPDVQAQLEAQQATITELQRLARAQQATLAALQDRLARLEGVRRGR